MLADQSRKERADERLAEEWLPVFDEKRCTGCRGCVDACGPKSLELVGKLAVLHRPDTCGSEAHCIQSCPEQATRMASVGNRGDTRRDLWRTAA